MSVKLSSWVADEQLVESWTLFCTCSAGQTDPRYDVTTVLMTSLFYFPICDSVIYCLDAFMTWSGYGRDKQGGRSAMNQSVSDRDITM